jgi:hypothetical protein
MNERPAALHRSIEAAKGLRLDLARLLAGQDGEISADDAQALQDTFDGETTLDEQIRLAVLSIEEDEIFVTGCKARETELKARRSRLEKRIEATRGLIEQAMTIAGWPKLEMDIGTVTLAKAKPRIEIDEESAIPTQFWKRQDPTLDKAGLGKVLNERQKALEAALKIDVPEERARVLAKLNEEMPAIPGCHLETEGVSLTIRRS